MSTLNAIWAELALNTKPFKAGLSQSAELTQQWGRKIAGDMRMAFFNALSPQRWMASTVSAVAKAMADINRITGEAQRAQIDFGAENIPLDEMTRMVALADQLGLSIENMVKLWQENGEGAAAFRTTLSSLPGMETTDPTTQAASRGLGAFWGDMVKGPGELLDKYVSWASKDESGIIAPWLKKLFNDAFVEPGEALIEAEENIRRMMKEYQEVLKQRAEQEKERLRLEEAAKEARRTQLGSVIDRGHERSRRLMGSAQDFSFGSPQAGGLAGIGGFTGGAAIAAATTGIQQVRLLSMIAENTRVLAQVAEAERELTSMD